MMALMDFTFKIWNLLCELTLVKLIDNKASLCQYIIT